MVWVRLFFMMILSSSANSECMGPVRPAPQAIPPGPGPGPGPGPMIVSVRQLDLSCPTARSCPGSNGIRDICASLAEGELFRCDLSWSTGASGYLEANMTVVAEFVTTMLSELCGACADTLSLSSSFDVGVEIPVM